MITQRLRSLMNRFPRDYPYTYARVSAKRAKLLERKDYDNLLKMQPSEIARNLEEGDYKDEIEELGDRYSGVELVELSLSRNLSNTMAELIKISPDPLNTVLQTYLRRYDVLSLKRIIRAKKTGESVRGVLTPVSRFTFEELEAMNEMEVAEIIESIDFPETEVNYSGEIEPEMPLREIEMALDAAFHEDLRGLIGMTESKVFEKFIEQEIRYEQIVNSLRLKKYGAEEEDIEKSVSNGLPEIVREIASADDLDSAIETVCENEGVENGSLEALERELERKRLNSALKLLHQEPLGAASILGYVVAKTAEVKNLRTLIRGREAGMESEAIRRELIIDE